MSLIDEYWPYLSGVAILIVCAVAFEAWRRWTIAGMIATARFWGGRKQQAARAKLVGLGPTVLPVLNRERGKIHKQYLQLRELQGRPIGETVIRDVSDIPADNIMLIEQDVYLGAIMDEIESISRDK